MISRPNKLVTILLCALFLSVTHQTIQAQTVTATITGIIADAQGAGVANARVVATNQETKREYSVQTNTSGLYTISFLPIGSYVISVEANGFKKIVSNSMQLEVNQTARVDLNLEVGDLSQVVEVTDIAPVLETEKATVGEVISGTTTTNLPLNGRNFQQLTLLVPGSITYDPGNFTDVGLSSGQGRPLVNGNREQGNTFLLDGVPIDETIDNRIGYKPSIDAIAEFRMETSNQSSEFGNVTGATVLVSLKSGTNNFHGNVFEFFRNDALDARRWELNRIGGEKQKLRQNIFGGTIGGPIRKDKIFFFGDYQGTQARTGGGGQFNVAPVTWRAGDFSSLLNNVDPAKRTYIKDPLKSGTCSFRDQTACFPGNIIPAGRIVNPAARALFANQNYYPLPSGILTDSGVGFYDAVTANSVSGNQFDIKIDAVVTDKDSIFGRYYFANFNGKGQKGPLPIVMTGNTSNRPQGVALGWTRSITPTLINDARFGFSRATFIGYTFDWANIGNANATFGIPGGQAIPGLSSIAMVSGLDNLGALGTNENNVTNTFFWGDVLTYTRGAHQIKGGGQIIRYQQNRFYPGNNGLLGGFSYAGNFTNFGFSDFLLDQLSNKSIGNTGGLNPGPWGHRQTRLGFFAQDDWKFRPNLTFNLGVRWEYTQPLVEVADRQTNYVLYTGQLQFAGKNGNSRALYDSFFAGIEPRIGVAWTPEYFKNRMVVRAGYGITQFMEGTGANLRLPLNYPYFSEADRSYRTDTGAGTITTGFEDVINASIPSGLVRIWNKKIRPQFTQQWNLSLEYQIFNSMSVTAAYVGHDATHLVAPTDFNQPLPGVGAPGTWSDPQTRRPLYGPLPNVTFVSGTDTWGVSRYNSLQLSARQRYLKGSEFIASYTLSKALTDSLGYYGGGGGAAASQSAYPYNQYARHQLNYGPAFFDARHNFILSGTYELPIGKDRAYFNNMRPWLNAIFGNWNIKSILQFRSGFPITVVTSEDNTFQLPRGGQKPNLIGNPKPLKQSLTNWLNPLAFARPGDGTFGNSGIGVIRSKGFANWDFGIAKMFNVYENQKLDFRVEFFNFLNHPNFGPPPRNYNDTNVFGNVLSLSTPTVGSPRVMEFVLKYSF